MKRLVFLFVVIVIIAGVVFYFGWIQIKLEEDSYAIVFTKTNGWEEEHISPGEFAWRWQRLIPTNLTLHEFPITPHATSATLRGNLPSGSTYGALLETANPFSFVISVDVIYRIRPASLAHLVRDDGLRSDTLGIYYRRMDTEMEQPVPQFGSDEVEKLADFLQTFVRRQTP